ncbi:Uncharacterised protein [Morganella morganii]|nr:Uncharacterised protein [Morganella morganii]
MFTGDNCRYLLLVVFCHFEKASSIDNHLIEMERETHFLAVNLALVLIVIVINKMVSHTQRFHIRELTNLVKVDPFE